MREPGGTGRGPSQGGGQWEPLSLPFSLALLALNTPPQRRRLLVIARAPGSMARLPSSLLGQGHVFQDEVVPSLLSGWLLASLSESAHLRLSFCRGEGEGRGHKCEV